MKKIIIGLVIVFLLFELELYGEINSKRSDIQERANVVQNEYNASREQWSKSLKESMLTEEVKTIKQEYAYREMTELENQLIELVNDYRKENGLGQVKKTDILQESALFKSTTMLEYDYFGSTNPFLGENKNSAWMAENYPELPSFQGENIFYTKNINITAYDLFEKFKKSPPQNELMLHNGVGIIGIGIIISVSSGDFYDGLPVCVVTMHFGN